MIESISVVDVTLGMFVADLDRPWAETSFALQGFVVENEAEIAELRRFCRTVMVDRARSSGDAYRADAAAAKAPNIVRKVVMPTYVHHYQEVKASAPNARQGVVATLRQVVKEAVVTPEAKTLADTGSHAPLGVARIVDNTQQLSRNQAAQLAQYAANKQGDQLHHAIERDAAASALSAEERALIDPNSVANEKALGSAGGFDYAKFSAKVYTGEAGKSDVQRALEKHRGKGLVGNLKNLFGKSETPAEEEVVVDVVAHQQQAVYPDRATVEEELPSARAVHAKAEEMVQSVLTDIRANKAPEMSRVQEAVGYMVESVIRNPDALMWLSRLKSEDSYTYEHGLNCSIYMMAFGRHMGLASDSLQVLGAAGLMQDVGKIRLSHDLIERRGDLEWEEFEMIKTHVQHSLEILQASSNTSPLVIDVVAQHHERADGSGYPHGLAGEQIWQLGGMAGIVDVYTALTASRPYAGPIPSQEALRSLYDWRGTYFDDNLIEQFIQCIGIYPVGSLVELNTGEVAVVVSQNRKRRLRPRVMMILDIDKQPVARPRMLDLMLDPLTQTGTMYAITQALSANAYDMSAANETQLGLR